MLWVAVSYDCRGTLVAISNTLTADLYVSLVIKPLIQPFLNSIQGRVFLQDDAHPYTTVVTQRSLQNVDMLPWPVRSTNLSPIKCL
ncbi:uncharacterized protein TNCV_2071071 [Trichonephila clavipes]|uniref:Transposase n=1 Tax=Trichonephila clavipes TaxID=2585209 RepID=A0A8X6W389_TRICX|nr:uncharacterized protein TNCV_2071071 [Trichonephila clavipes]